MQLKDLGIWAKELGNRELKDVYRLDWVELDQT